MVIQKISESKTGRSHGAKEILSAADSPLAEDSARVRRAQEIIERELLRMEAEKHPAPRTWADFKPAISGLSAVALIAAATLLAPATGGSSLWLLPAAALALSQI